MSVHRDPTNDRRATPRPGAPPPNGRAAGAAPAPLPVGPEERDRVSHELRTPLNAILGYAELLLDGSAGPLSAQARECAAHIQDAGRRLLHEVETWHRRADQRATPAAASERRR